MKNHKIISKYPLLDEFISNLLYPAILGSLIYDFTKVTLSREYLLLSITVIFYIVDYFYMHYALKDLKEKKLSMTLIDLLVAFVFMIIIYSIHKLYQDSNNESTLRYNLILLISLSTLIISNSAFIYYYVNEKITIYIFILLFINSLIMVIQQLIIHCWNLWNWNLDDIITYSYTIMVFVYILEVIVDYSYDNWSKIIELKKKLLKALYNQTNKPN